MSDMRLQVEVMFVLLKRRLLAMLKDLENEACQTMEEVRRNEFKRFKVQTHIRQVNRVLSFQKDVGKLSKESGARKLQIHESFIRKASEDHLEYAVDVKRLLDKELRVSQEEKKFDGVKRAVDGHMQEGAVGGNWEGGAVGDQWQIKSVDDHMQKGTVHCNLQEKGNGGNWREKTIGENWLGGIIDGKLHEEAYGNNWQDGAAGDILQEKWSDLGDNWLEKAVGDKWVKGVVDGHMQTDALSNYLEAKDFSGNWHGEAHGGNVQQKWSSSLGGNWPLTGVGDKWQGGVVSGPTKAGIVRDICQDKSFGDNWQGGAVGGNWDQPCDLMTSYFNLKSQHFKQS